jgi:hypothetical protein
MSSNALNPFPPDALDANRRGELTDAQLRAFRGLSRIRRKGALDIAGTLAVIGLLIVFFASPTYSAVLRVLIPIGCLAIAAFLVVRSIGGGDALTRDLRQGQVQSIEGAIGKRRISSLGDGDFPTYFLEVGDSRFQVMSLTFEAAPDAGYVRLYFLPHSRKVVNLERLPDYPVALPQSTQDLVRSFAAVVGSHDRREINEARAAMAGIGGAMKAAFAQPLAPAPEARDPRPLGEAILGTWSNGMVTAKFSADGRVSTSILGRENVGRWSVDADGRLRADVTGQPQSAQAWVSGNQLIISAEGKGLTLTREA